MEKILNYYDLTGVCHAGFAEEIRVCVDQYPPFKIIEDNKVIGGIDLQLTDALTDAVGLKPVYKYYPWTRCLRNLEKGISDLVSGITKRADREQYLHYIEPPYKTKSVKIFYVNRMGKKKIDIFEDLSGLTVGVLRGSKYFDRFDNSAKIIKYDISDDLRGLKMLASKRKDAFITTEEVGDYLIKTSGLSNYIDKAGYRFNKGIEVYFAISKKSNLAGKLSEFNKKAKELKEKGVFDNIMENFSKNH